MRHIRQPAAHVGGKGWSQAIVGDLCFKKPGFCFSNIKRLRKKVGQQQDFHTLLAQRVCEDVMLFTRPFNREHVIK
ncbi:Uncharacterised protein [Enterobacter cloacae]|nr:Uncharacterised protein [Enterobacter cloacae]